jgi:hypothetical protein
MKEREVIMIRCDKKDYEDVREALLLLSGDNGWLLDIR